MSALTHFVKQIATRREENRQPNQWKEQPLAGGRASQSRGKGTQRREGSVAKAAEMTAKARRKRQPQPWKGQPKAGGKRCQGRGNGS